MKTVRVLLSLKVGIWDFIGIWDLVIGHSLLPFDFVA
jgi:hypothetical protein